MRLNYCVGFTRIVLFAAILGAPVGVLAAADAGSPAATTPKSPEPAKLVSKDDVATLTGQPVSGVESAPAAPDPDTGGVFAFCSFTSGSSEVIVAVVNFATAAEAATKLTKEFAAKTQADETPNVVPEADLGERAFWVTSESGAEYVILKGSSILAIGIGGRPPKPVIAYRDALRTLSKSALEKL